MDFNSNELSMIVANHSTNHTASAPSPTEPWIRSVVYTIFLLTFLFGITANLVVCKAICERKQKKRAIHYLMLNLAVCDILVLMIYLPTQVYQIDGIANGEIGKVICKLQNIIYVMSVNVKIMTLLAVTAERYFDVTDPFTLHTRAGGRLKSCIVVIWLLSVVVAIPFLVQSDVRQRTCYDDWDDFELRIIQWVIFLAVHLTLPTFFFVVTFSIIGYRTCNERVPREVAALYKAMGRSDVAPMRRSNIAAKQSWTAVRKKQQTKLIKLAITLVVLYFVCVCPQHLVQLGIIKESEMVSNVINILTLSKFLFILNSLANPVVYGVQGYDVTRVTHRLICFWRGHTERKSSTSWSRRRLLTLTSSNASSSTSEFYF